MAWRITTGPGRDGAGKPIQRFRATPDGEGGLSDEQAAVVRRAVLRRALGEGLIPAHDADSWARSLESNLFETIEILNEMEAARNASANGGVAAAGRRAHHPGRVHDGEALLA